MMKPSRFILHFIVAILAMTVTEKSYAFPKSFAVFVAYYNRTGNKAQGGVAGTAFFVSPNRAITAFHVLQPASFHPALGFERVRIWLVHENYRAIELKPSELVTRRLNDITEIHLRRPVARRFVFKIGRVKGGAAIETQGVLADSVGPMLVRRGADLRIVAVPKLDRHFLKGRVLGVSKVTMRARDVKLAAAPCLRLSYKPIVGFSGGPVVSNGAVIGMNSFADPATRAQTWALNLSAIRVLQ